MKDPVEAQMTTDTQASDNQAAESQAMDMQALGRRLKIRSMVQMAGEVLPFFWPMRNFIHHNPLHGLEHLPFEEAVRQASALFHARGYLPRADYQRMLRDGAIEPEVIAELIEAFVADWLRTHDRDAADPLGAQLQQILLAMMTRTSQPVPGLPEPSAEEILRALRARPANVDEGPA